MVSASAGHKGHIFSQAAVRLTGRNNRKVSPPRDLRSLAPKQSPEGGDYAFSQCFACQSYF